jgi:hypothetical protein
MECDGTGWHSATATRGWAQLVFKKFASAFILFYPYSSQIKQPARHNFPFPQTMQPF